MILNLGSSDQLLILQIDIGKSTNDDLRLVHPKVTLHLIMRHR